MNNSKLIIAVVVALVIGGAAGFYYGAAKGKSQGLEEGKKAGLAEAAENAKKEAAEAVNPFSGTQAPVNPFAEKTNPLEKVRTNPFE